MFWGCFCWAQRGPFYIWEKEKAKERKETERELNDWNQEHEAEHKAAWEEEQGLKIMIRNLERLQLQQKRRGGGRKAQWKHTEATGAKVRRAKAGGIDWYRYQKECLIPLYFPFIRKCLETNPYIIAQEDKAPSHNCKWNKELWATYNLRRIIWPGNSPDLSPIEPL